MLDLYFVPSKFPRNIKRSEWRDIWRWKRVTVKAIQAETRRQMLDLAAFGSTVLPQARAEMIEKMVRPPLLVHHRMELSP